MKNQCPTCGQDMREEPREDCPQCGQSLPAAWRLIPLDNGQQWLTDGTNGFSPDGVIGLLTAAQSVLSRLDDNKIFPADCLQLRAAIYNAKAQG